MARIPETEIERLKNEVSVQRLIEASGIELKKTGKDLTGCCPFHEDDTASLVVTPAKNLWHCFGCGAAGGPIDWVIKKNGVSFRHAVELLREGVPSLAAGSSVGSGNVKRTTVRALEAPVALDADEQALLNQVIDYYHETLKTSPEALAYLQTRGIASTEAVEHFKLGYADRTLGLRLPQKNRVAGSEIRSRLQKIGIYRESGHEHFNGSLIVPVLNEQGNVIEVYGRKLLDNLRAGTPKHLYLPVRSGGRGVFNVQALQANKEIILCEALIDALTFWCAGFRNVTSAYGIEGFTEDMLAAFKQHGTERVLIAYDRDEAGERGAAKVSALLMSAGIECFRIQFPKGMDANEYALKVTPASKSLGVVIRKAVWLGQGKPPALPTSEPHPTTPEAPSILASEASPLAAESFAAKECASSESFAAKECAPVDEAPALPASPVPDAPAGDVPCSVTGNEITFTLGDRRYRVRGLAKNLSFELLKINLLVSRGEVFYVDTLDLYAAKQRQSYLTHAAIELQVKEDILKADLGRVLLALESLQQAALDKALQPAEPVAVQMSEAERGAALDLLNAPDLLARILQDFEACGIVGETTNKLVAYLAATSRLLDAPLAVVIQSSSAAGKSALMDAVLALMPEEQRIKYSAMTGQSLFYMGETNLKHKILAIVEEEGASRASYALKLLQSEGELTIASTGKDPVSGNLTTQQYRVEGPVMLFLTTTAIEIDEELLNRCLVLSVDEGREQTAAIHQLQRQKRTLAGLLSKTNKKNLLRLHRNAQHLLKPLAVVNPYADQLTFLSDKTRTRRDHEKYLTLIDTITLLHQYQRPIKTTRQHGTPLDYIEVTPDDIAAANVLAHETLGRSLDELPPQTRRLLLLIDAMVKQQCATQNIARTDYRFSRRDVRNTTGWSDFQVKVHMQKLTELEYLLPHRGGRGSSFEYELIYDGDGSEQPRLFGLLDVAALRYDDKKEHQKPGKEGSSSPQGGIKLPPSSVPQLPEEARQTGVAAEQCDTDAETHCSRHTHKIASYPQPLPLVAAAR